MPGSSSESCSDLGAEGQVRVTTRIDFDELAALRCRVEALDAGLRNILDAIDKASEESIGDQDWRILERPYLKARALLKDGER